jgi:ferredoxin
MIDMIDTASEASRLCCQIKVTDTLDGLVVRVPGAPGKD